MKKKIIFYSVLFVVCLTLGIILGVVNHNKQKNLSSSSDVNSNTDNTVGNNLNTADDKFLQLTPLSTEKVKEDVTLETDIYKVVFDTNGASVKSVVLKEYTENGQPLEMFMKFSEEDRAFKLYPSRVVSTASPIEGVYSYSINKNSIIFENIYSSNNSQNIKIRKTYTLGEKEYMIRLKVEFLSLDGSQIKDDGDYAYSLAFENQIGPSFVNSSSKGSRQNSRSFYLKFNNKKNKKSIAFKNNLFTYEGEYQWFELTGKYFSLIMVPEKDNTHISAITSGSEKDKNLNSKMYISRLSDSTISDTYNIYLGPQLKNKMIIFNRSQDNSFGLENLNIERGIENGGGIFNWIWLQNCLKWIMTLFYKIIPNWGVSIILLTILIKLLMYPLQKKSLESTARLSEFTPRLQEIREQYKDDPQKMNAATMALYKENNINPFSGIWPMLIQLPLLIGIYGLLNSHFELRGSVFINGWINDLSSPETVLTFPFSLPFIGNELHILPILYLVTMFLLMNLTQKQNTATQSSGMQKFMSWGFPIIFFFIFYNYSSGLLLYWTMINIFSIIQQIITNASFKKKKEEKEQREKKVVEEKTNSLFTGVLPPKARGKNKR